MKHGIWVSFSADIHKSLSWEGRNWAASYMEKMWNRLWMKCCAVQNQNLGVEKKIDKEVWEMDGGIIFLPFFFF